MAACRINHPSISLKQKGDQEMGWITRKRALIVLGCACAIGITGIAIGYFTSSGAGTGAATVGSSSSVTLHATISSNLFPGSSSPVTMTVDNPSSGVQRIGTVSLSSITVDAGHSSCATTISGGNPDFTMAAVPVNQVFPPGNGQTVSATGTLAMNETGVNQDACQAAILTLHLTNN
jgi:hypothetical protein